VGKSDAAEWLTIVNAQPSSNFSISFLPSLLFFLSQVIQHWQVLQGHSKMDATRPSLSHTHCLQIQGQKALITPPLLSPQKAHRRHTPTQQQPQSQKSGPTNPSGTNSTSISMTCTTSVKPHTLKLDSAPSPMHPTSVFHISLPKK
jgi:hypothetical protein